MVWHHAQTTGYAQQYNKLSLHQWDANLENTHRTALIYKIRNKQDNLYKELDITKKPL